jgi:hypothetical protein
VAPACRTRVIRLVSAQVACVTVIGEPVNNCTVAIVPTPPGYSVEG